MSISLNQYSVNNNCSSHGVLKHSKDTPNERKFIGAATSRTISSENGKRIGITTVGDRGYIAMCADSSTEQEPIVKVGDYEVRINAVDPKNATRMEMFALMSYMDDKGLIDNHGMKSFNKMTAYSDCASIGSIDDEMAWNSKYNWIDVLEEAKETFLRITQTYRQGIECQKIIDGLNRWWDPLSNFRVVTK